MLCLRCWHWWPADSRYCGVCQNSLNGRRCADGHLNTLWGTQQTCSTCNKPLLTSGVPALPMNWLPTGGAILGLIWLGYQAVLHLNVLLDAAFRGVMWVLAGTLHSIPPGVWLAFQNVLAVWVALYLMSLFLPKDLGGPFRQFLIGSARTACRWFASLFMMLGRAMFSLFKACMRNQNRVRTNARHEHGRERDRDETPDRHRH